MPRPHEREAAWSRGGWRRYFELDDYATAGEMLGFTERAASPAHFVEEAQRQPSTTAEHGCSYVFVSAVGGRWGRRGIEPVSL